MGKNGARAPKHNFFCVCVFSNLSYEMRRHDLITGEGLSRPRVPGLAEPPQGLRVGERLALPAVPALAEPSHDSSGSRLRGRGRGGGRGASEREPHLLGGRGGNRRRSGLLAEDVQLSGGVRGRPGDGGRLEGDDDGDGREEEGGSEEDVHGCWLCIVDEGLSK